MTVNEGDKITGHLTCAPNARNNRDLDITIAYKAPTDEEDKVVSYKMCVPFRTCLLSVDIFLYENIR